MTESHEPEVYWVGFESAAFTRDGSGRATEVKIGAVVFKRRQEATGLQVHPAEPIAELFGG